MLYSEKVMDHFTKIIKGKPLSKALALTNKAVAEALDGLPPVKMHCSVLAEGAVKRRCRIITSATNCRMTPVCSKILGSCPATQEPPSRRWLLLCFGT